jgi:hypothetical protein
VIRGVVPPLGIFFDKRQQLLSTLVQRNLLGQVPEKRASVSPNSDFAMFNKVQEWGVASSRGVVRVHRLAGSFSSDEAGRICLFSALCRHRLEPVLLT